MAKLKDATHLIVDGEVCVYRRERSKRWQASFNIDGHTVRISTGKRDVSEAKEYARDTHLEYKFRHKNDLPIENPCVAGSIPALGTTFCPDGSHRTPQTCMVR